MKQNEPSMHVLLDGVAFENDQQRGVRRYFHELVPRLGDTVAVDMLLRCPAVGELPSRCRSLRLARPMADAASPLLRKIGRRLPERGWANLRNGHQLFHSTFYGPAPVADLPEVVTVHDMILERYPHLFSHLVDETIAMKKRAIESARVCIAISQATADELAAFYPHVAERTVVIHHGADHLIDRAPEAAPPEVADKSFILFVGDRGGYKNFRVLLEAAAGRDWPPGLGIVVVGGAFSAAEALLLRAMGLEERVTHAGRVGDAELAGLYRRAAALVVPSLDEGFGFPGLEAQSFGTPVLCSRIRVFEEILGESAEYFDPRLAESIAAAAGKVSDPAWRRRLVEAGMENLRRFTWARCAELTRQAYQKAVA